MLTRAKFIAEIDKKLYKYGPSTADDSHALWEAEKQYTPRVKCKWFVCVPPFFTLDTKKEYWEWINSSLHGKCVCYLSDNKSQEEWWGFTDKRDITNWVLKYA